MIDGRYTQRARPSLGRTGDGDQPRHRSEKEVLPKPIHLRPIGAKPEAAA